MSKFLTRKVSNILSITTAVLVISTACIFLFIYNHIEGYFQEDYDYAETILEMNGYSFYDIKMGYKSNAFIYDSIADLKKDIFWDKYIVFWNDDTFLRSSYSLLGRIYLRLNEPRDALKELYLSQQILMQNKEYSQAEYIDLEYRIGLAYKSMNENNSAYEHFQNVIDRVKELIQNGPDSPNETADVDNGFILSTYAILATMDYKAEDYDEAYKKFVLSQDVLLEFSNWNFASFRYNNITPYLLIFCSDYAAKSAEKIGNIKYKEYYEIRNNIYKHILDYQEDTLEQLYSFMVD